MKKKRKIKLNLQLQPPKLQLFHYKSLLNFYDVEPSRRYNASIMPEKQGLHADLVKTGTLLPTYAILRQAQ